MVYGYCLSTVFALHNYQNRKLAHSVDHPKATLAGPIFHQPSDPPGILIPVCVSSDHVHLVCKPLIKEQIQEKKTKCLFCTVAWQLLTSQVLPNSPQTDLFVHTEVYAPPQ